MEKEEFERVCRKLSEPFIGAVERLRAEGYTVEGPILEGPIIDEKTKAYAKVWLDRDS